WARNPGRKTEYDLFLSDLAERGVKAVDLRPALKAARSQGKVYLRHDSHWTPRGAIAGYNAVIEADGHPDWRVDPATALGPPTLVKGGDLAPRGRAGPSDRNGRAPHPPVEGRRRTNLRGRDAGPRCCDRQSRKDRHGDRRFVYGLLFHANVVRACGTCGLDPSSSVRVRLAPHRQVSPRRCVVGADRTLSHLRSGRAPDPFS